MSKPYPTAERLRELQYYEPDTGVFTRRVRVLGWKVGTVSGTIGNHGYRLVRVDGVEYLAHRLAWLYVHGVLPVKQIDHINGVRTDNRLCNLREANQSENNQNQRKARSNNKVGLLGVHPCLNGFTSQIKVNGVVRCLGVYSSAELAHLAYLEAKRELHPYSTL